MPFEFDPEKDASNQLKLGVSLRFAAALDWELAYVWIDDRFPYAEVRMIALIPLGENLFYVAFVNRGDVRRVISLRRANNRERKHYGEHA